MEIIANDQGNRTTPSYVGFTDSERLIGDAAKNQVAMNPVNTVRPCRACFPYTVLQTACARELTRPLFSIQITGAHAAVRAPARPRVVTPRAC